MDYENYKNVILMDILLIAKITQLYYTAKFLLDWKQKIPCNEGIFNKSLFFITSTVSTDS